MKSFRNFNRLCLCLLFLASNVKAAAGAGHAGTGMTVDDILRDESLRGQLARVVAFSFESPGACSNVKGTLNGLSTAREGLWESAQIFGKHEADDGDLLSTMVGDVQASKFKSTAWPNLPHQGFITVKSTSDTKTIVINFADSPNYASFMGSNPEKEEYSPLLKMQEDPSVHRRLTNFFRHTSVEPYKTQLIRNLAILAAYLEPSLFEVLTPLLTADHEYNIMVTGHGIGGALAQIFAPIIFQEMRERTLQAQINLLAFGGPTVYRFHAAQHVRNVLGKDHIGIFATQRHTDSPDPLPLEFRTPSMAGGLVPLFSWAGGEEFSYAEGHNAWAHPVDITYLPSSSLDIHQAVSYSIALEAYTPPEPVIAAAAPIADGGATAVAAGTSALVVGDAPPTAAAAGGAGLLPAVTGAAFYMLRAPGAVAGYAWGYVPDVAGRVSQVSGLATGAASSASGLLTSAAASVVPSWAPAWMQPTPAPAAHPIPSPAFTLTAAGFTEPEDAAVAGAGAGAAATPEPTAPSPGLLAAIYGRLPDINITAMLNYAVMPIIDHGYTAAKMISHFAVKTYVEGKRYLWADCNILFHKTLEGDAASFKLLETRSKADPIAQAYMAIALSLGIGVEQNVEIAKRLAAEAVLFLKYWAECGIGDAQIALGQLYEDNLVPADNKQGVETPQDTRLWGAQALYRTAAIGGYVEAIYRLGLYYKRNNDMDNAIQTFTMAAAKNHPHAMNELGLAAMPGSGDFGTSMTSTQEEEAIFWFTKAAAAGLPSAKFNLARIYLWEGINKDKKKAQVPLQEALDAGYLPAMEAAGSLAYAEGKYTEAKAHLERAISTIPDQAAPRDFCHRFKSIRDIHSNAHFKLYLMHRFGHLGTGKPDMDTANTHFAAASALGHLQTGMLSSTVLAYKALPLSLLASQYQEGKGLPKDLEAAWQLAEEASKARTATMIEKAARIRLEMLGKILTPLTATAPSEHEKLVHQGREAFIPTYKDDIHCLVDALQELSRGTELYTRVKRNIEEIAREIYAKHNPAASSDEGGASASATAGAAAGAGGAAAPKA